MVTVLGTGPVTRSQKPDGPLTPEQITAILSGGPLHAVSPAGTWEIHEFQAGGSVEGATINASGVGYVRYRLDGSRIADGWTVTR